MTASAPLRLGLFYGGLFLALGIFGPFWPLWLKARGLSAEEIGLVFALGTLARVIVTPTIARAADQAGECKRILVLLCALAAVTFLAFRWTHSFWPIALVSMLFFACRGPTMPLTESLTMLTRRTVNFDYGRVRLWGSVTFIAGAWGMGYVLTGAPDSWIHWAVFGSVILTFLIALALPDTRVPGAAHGRGSFGAVLRVPGLAVAVLAATCIQASHAVYYNFGTIHWLAAGHAPDVIGALWAEGVVAEIVLFTVGAAVVRRTGALPLILIGAIVGVARWAGTAATTDLAALAVLQALHALSFGATHLGIIHLISERTEPSQSATAQSIYAIALGLGMSGASYGAGLLFGAFGGGAFMAMAVLSGLGIAFTGLAFLALRRQPAAG